MYWLQAPQNADYPYITFAEVSKNPGASDLVNNAGLQIANYQIDVKGEDEPYQREQAVREDVGGDRFEPEHPRRVYAGLGLIPDLTVRPFQRATDIVDP